MSDKKFPRYFEWTSTVPDSYWRFDDEITGYYFGRGYTSKSKKTVSDMLRDVEAGHIRELTESEALAKVNPVKGVGG